MDMETSIFHKWNWTISCYIPLNICPMRLSCTYNICALCSIGINRNSNKTSFINDFNQDTVNKEAFNYAKNDSESDQYDIFFYFVRCLLEKKKSELV